jgi:hypothetical protein
MKLPRMSAREPTAATVKKSAPCRMVLVSEQPFSIRHAGQFL